MERAIPVFLLKHNMYIDCSIGHFQLPLFILTLLIREIVILAFQSHHQIAARTADSTLETRVKGLEGDMMTCQNAIFTHP